MPELVSHTASERPRWGSARAPSAEVLEAVVQVCRCTPVRSSPTKGSPPSWLEYSRVARLVRPREHRRHRGRERLDLRAASVESWLVLSRPPCAPLRPFVKTLWASSSEGASSGSGLERVLPTGLAHVVLRVSSSPLRVMDASAGALSLGLAVVGGARSRAYVRDVSEPSRAFGALLLPGAAALLLRCPAEELAERHTPLDALWGREAELLRERLGECATPEAGLALFEAALLARLPRERGVHPAVANALASFERGAAVAHAVDASGLSHRAFVALFRAQVGLAPKLHCRVLRLQRALAALRRPRARLATVAVEAGYADQAHLTRELLELTGLTPTHYLRAAGEASHHVPVR